MALKMKEELNYKFNWWLYLQIKDLFNSDKRKYGNKQWINGNTYGINRARFQRVPHFKKTVLK